jgi:ferredoxin-type protein NapH
MEGVTMKTAVNTVRVLFLALFLFLLRSGKMNLWLILFGASLLLALFFGRVFCGYVCPMHTLMIPTEWLARKLNWQTKKKPDWLSSGVVAWVGLILSVAVMIYAKRVLKRDIPILLFWIALAVLVTLRYRPEVFHNLLCPFGVLQRVFGRPARFSQMVTPEGCIGCTKCVQVCPAEAVRMKVDNKALITPGACLQCTSCTQVCPTKTIKYQSIHVKPAERVNA